MKRLLWAAMPLLLWNCSSAPQLTDTQVMTKSGIVEGVKEADRIIFRGVPFADAPVGDLRWKEPQPVTPWEGVKLCKEFGDDPMQPSLFGDMNFLAKGRSEDCLYLNIWAPQQAKDCPVLIYFNGGGLMCGSGSEPRYAGDSLASHGIIAITANYREGVFGYLAHPELTAESPNHTSGNYGALDQVAAIQWVYDNISAFGGDPKKITIVGESAGSFSVSVLMASPLSKHLLGGAMGSSGAELKPSYAQPLANAEEKGAALLQSKGVSSIAELRALSADSVQKLLPPMGMSSIVVDGYLLPATVDEIFAKNEQAQVPLLVGWNSMEAHPSQLLRGQAPTLKNLEQALTPRFGDRTKEVMTAFGIKTDADVMGWGATELAGSLFTAFPTWKWAELHKASGQPVYRYKFNHPRPAMAVQGKVAGLAGGVKDADEKEAAEAQKQALQGAVHSADIEYAMGNLKTNLVYAWTEGDFKVEHTFLNFYANFIKTYNPNGEGLPTWQTINDKEVAPVMQIDVDSEEKADAQLEAAYRLLDEVLE